MNEDELLEQIERNARAAFAGCAIAAGEGSAFAPKCGRAALLVARIAELLRRLPQRSSGDLSILRMKLGELAVLLEHDHELRSRLVRDHLELGARTRALYATPELARVAEAFERKAG